MSYNISEYAAKFVEERLKSSALIGKYIAAGMGIFQDTAGENARKPYVRYMVEKPSPLGERDLMLRQGAFEVSVTVNILGNSKEQVRELSTEVRELFDGIISPEGFEHIEDCTADEPEENFPFDADTKAQIFETSQGVNFNYVK